MASSSTTSTSLRFGFQPGHVFKIVSLKDRYTIEVKESSLEPGAKVVTHKWKDRPNQKFRTLLMEDGREDEYQISAVLQPSDGTRLVWDFIPGEGLVIHNTASGSPNQVWTCERVYPKDNNIWFIKTKDDLCLTNMGKGKQLLLKPKDIRDPYQHWRLQATSSN